MAEIHTDGWRFAYRGIVPDQELYVEPAFVRQGVGGRRMAAAEAAGAGAGRSSLKLWALEANHRGCRFYESVGYTFDGTTKVIPGWNGAVERRYSKTLDR